MDQPSKSSLHPVVLIAAIALTLLCLTGIAAIMGWLPTSKSSADTPLAAAPGSALSTLPAPAASQTATTAQNETVDEVRSKSPAKEKADAEHTGSASAANADERCTHCGVVESIHTLTKKGEGTGLGAVGGAVVGGVLGNQVGEGSGKQIARIGGAVLGGFAGNEVEKRARAETQYRIKLRMDDGSIRTVEQKNAPNLQQGQRVRVDNGVVRTIGN